MAIDWDRCIREDAAIAELLRTGAVAVAVAGPHPGAGGSFLA